MASRSSFWDKGSRHRNPSPGSARSPHVESGNLSSGLHAGCTPVGTERQLGFALCCKLTRLRRPDYPEAPRVSPWHDLFVTAGVRLSLFRFHLTMDTLALPIQFPSSGPAWDFHPRFPPSGRTTQRQKRRKRALFYPLSKARARKLLRRNEEKNRRRLSLPSECLGQIFTQFL